MKLRLGNLKKDQSNKDIKKDFKIMLIDDEKENIFGIEKVLEKKYEVVTFSSAVDAFTHLNQNPNIEYATILSDQIMPAMTGVEFFTKLNESAHPSPRILLTGFAGLDNVVSAINDAAIHRYLKKPIDLQELEVIVNESVALYKITKENSHLLEQMKKVFYPHQLEKIKKGSFLEETMPQGINEACVISFDVIASSQINHPELVRFFRQFFSRCGDIMRENYNPNLLESNAFRVKEMGDGFLCSVGFPFHCPQGQSLAEGALSLAVRFESSFRDMAKSQNFNSPVHCGIGIASGKIEGFYTESHPIEYDLYGRGLVLANRYEKMRKLLFNKLGIKASIIILQEAVFQNLSKEKQSLYTPFNLDEAGIQVRDDKNARCLYFRTFPDK